MRSMVALIVLGMTLGGCAQYAVTDPQTGKTYHARHVKRKLNGTVVFRDIDTGSKVTLTDSEVRRLPRDEVVVESDRAEVTMR